MNQSRKMLERKIFGRRCKYETDDSWISPDLITKLYNDSCVDKWHIYPEHNNEYLEECLQNLKDKGIEIKFDR